MICNRKLYRIIMRTFISSIQIFLIMILREFCSMVGNSYTCIVVTEETY
uniref:Uncharacterized protein n=1 Tax=Podoviridae sp. ct8Lf7 TaxID=2827723 RepID=A0A8S5S0T9_9CAUD|nr:MAG TPA: hypothetical protein [Podoviridae sp. ct8Lf7]